MTPYEQYQREIDSIRFKSGFVSDAQHREINKKYTGNPDTPPTPGRAFDINLTGGTSAAPEQNPTVPTPAGGTPVANNTFGTQDSVNNLLAAISAQSGGGGGQPGGGSFVPVADLIKQKLGGGSTPQAKSILPNAVGRGGGATRSGAETAAGGGPDLSNLLAALTGQSQQANADSLVQHDALMKTAGRAATAVNQQQQAALNQAAQTRQAVEGSLAGLGATGHQRITDQERRQMAQTEQDAMSRGLGNTTIRNTLLGGVRRDAEQSRQALDESVANQRVSANLALSNLDQGLASQGIANQFGLAGMYGDALLSRQNVSPDLGTYLSLIQALAATAK